MIKMDEDESAVVSGDIENIVIKPESIELLFDEEEPYWMEDESMNSDGELPRDNIDECCFVTLSGEVVTLNNEDIVKTPFYLESYFLDNDRFRSKSLEVAAQQQQRYVIEVDRVTCYECDTVFCNELRLLEHLMTHIDIYRMGCNVCDKDLNLEEKFQLHTMAVTWQSIYYCDFCRKSCAGVVRSKSQPPPPGKTYMCHDCEYLTKQETMNFQNSGVFYAPLQTSSIQTLNPAIIPSQPSQLPALLPLPSQVLPTTTEVLQDNKQKPTSETKHENHSTENSTPEVQDCYKSQKAPTPVKTKENKKCRGPKPRVKVVSESMRQALKITTRSRSKGGKQGTRSYKCRFCPSLFTSNNALMQHLKSNHQFHKLRYICKFCSKEFSQQRSYENHTSVHQLAKNHMCFVCNLAFLSKRELEQHARFHNKSEFVNTFCGDVNDVALDLRKKKSTKSSA